MSRQSYPLSPNTTTASKRKNSSLQNSAETYKKAKTDDVGLNSYSEATVKENIDYGTERTKKRQDMNSDTLTENIDNGTERMEKRQDMESVSDDVEILCCEEIDLCEFGKKCPKFAKHNELIPIPRFSVDDLPPIYRENQLFDLIKSIADLVVRIMVKTQSSERSTFVKRQTWGSGWILRVETKSEKCSKQTCPCEECKAGPTPVTEWGEIIVCTAKHVVFNTEEALVTRCDLFYDTEGCRPERLSGSRMKASHFKKDVAEVMCVTHNLNLCEKLKHLCQVCDDLNDKVVRQYSTGIHNLAVIVSHPHGQEKRVSLGEWVKKIPSHDGDFQYTYTTATCQGSSGAPVFILNRDWCHGFSAHPHSGMYNSSCNRSGYGPA